MKKKSYRFKKKYPYYLIVIFFLFNIIACDPPLENESPKAFVDTSNFNFSNFGQQYLDQIPNDATIKKYDENRFCMIAGQILTEDGGPLPGVRVTIQGHPEYGSTLTDEKGDYSIPSEGGIELTMRYTKDDYTTIDRNIDAPVQDWVRAPIITMLKQDTKTTEIKLDEASIQLHTSSVTKDERGARSATLVFDEGTKATVTGKDGKTRDLTDIRVRATEFKTPESMPSDLPAESAYTYCADFKVDGVNDDEDISFNKPIVTYVENFLNFDVGEAVPMGYYDRKKGKWIAADNGVVIKLLDTDNDKKIDALDSSGDDKPDDLNRDGSFSDEIAGIIDDPKYLAGNTYWRAAIKHFTPWDYNWPAPPTNATAPQDINVDIDLEKENDCKANVNSYITTKTRIFHEDIPISGTNLNLHYSSQRVKGYKYSINISTSTTKPSGATRIVYKAIIGGRSLNPYIDGHPPFIWDGLDHTGKTMSGQIKGLVGIGFVYEPEYYNSSVEAIRAWARAGKVASGVTGRAPIVLWKYKDITINVEPKVRTIANGWTISGHNKAFGKMLAKGDGTTDSSTPFSSGIISTIAGKGKEKVNTTGIEAIKSSLSDIEGLTTDSQGNYYISSKNRVLKIDKSNTIKIIAGSLSGGFSGDGGLATKASLDHPTALATDKNGNIFVADTGNNRIRKITTDGYISTVAGGGNNSDYNAAWKKSGVPAIEAELTNIKDITIDYDNNLYISRGHNNTNGHIFKVNSYGIVKTIAGRNDPVGSGYNNIKALNASIQNPIKIRVDSYGNIYILQHPSYNLLKINTDGIVSDITPKGGLDRAGGMAIDKNNDIYISKGLAGAHIIKIHSNGAITAKGGGGSLKEDGVDAHRALIYPYSLAVDHEGSILLVDSRESVKKIGFLPVFYYKDLGSKTLLYKNKDNTAEVYDSLGDHIETIDLSTNKPLQEFYYNKDKELINIKDQFNNSVKINRRNDNKITIESPSGQKTFLTSNAKGDLTEVRYEDNSYYNFGYDDNSLMTLETDRNGSTFTHEFDEFGRFIKSIDSINGEWEFTKKKSKKSIIYTQKNPEGDIKYTKDSVDNSGNFTSEITLATGDVVTTKTSIDKKTSTIIADDTRITYTYDTDPNTQEKMLSSVLTVLPSGLTQTISSNLNYTGSSTSSTNKKQIITQNGNKNTEILTDYQNALIKITSPDKRITEEKYNKNTRLTSSITTGTLESINFTYDNKGRLIESSQGTGGSERKVELEYDDINSRGNLSKIIDPRGKETQFTYDVMDRVSSTTYPDGTTASFSYDPNGNMTKLITPSSNEFKFETNALDQPSNTFSPTNKSTSYEYNKNRELIKVTKPSGAAIENTYVDDRLSSTKTPEGTTQYNYLFANKLQNLTRGNESIDYTYNGTLLTNISQKGVLKQDISYDYNNDFNITQSSYAGKSTAYDYDKDGLLIRSGNFELTRHKENAYVTELSDGNLSQKREYNNYGELSKLSDNTFSYVLTKRDKSGLITQKKEIINGKTITYDYTFDDNGRLIDVKKDNQLVEKYVYDNNGNRTEATTNGITTRSSYNPDDQLESYGNNSYEYDVDGYLTKKTTLQGSITYEYGTLGELRKVVTPDKNIEYLHDANNQRIAKKINGEIVEKYLWRDLVTLFAVYDKDDNLVQRFEYAGQRMPVSMSQDGNQYYLHYDQVGSLRTVTDSSHTIVKEVIYDTYGNILKNTNPSFKVPFGFAGGLYDQDTRLTRFGLRDYDAFTGRWNAKDPIGFAGGDLNLYGYVLGNPVNLIDPSGEFGWVIAGAIIGGGLNVFSQYIGNGGWNNFSWSRLIASTAAGALGGGLGHAVSAIKWGSQAWAWQGAAVRAMINAGGSAHISAGTTFLHNCFTGSSDDVGRAALIGGVLGGVGSAVGEVFAGVAHSRYLSGLEKFSKHFPMTSKSVTRSLKYQNRTWTPKSIQRREIIGGVIGNAVANGSQDW